MQHTQLGKLKDSEIVDYMVLLSQRIAHMRQKFKTLQQQAVRVGLKVNATKTQEMRIWSPVNICHISWVGEILSG